MICPYCNQPILKRQEARLRIDKETGEEKVYHRSCFEMYLNELIDKVKEKEAL